MIGLLMTFHVLISVILIIAVLLQQEHKGGLGGIFGGSTQQYFGARGIDTFLMRVTIIFGTLFFISSILIALTIGSRQKIFKPEFPQKEKPVQQEMPGGE